MTGTQAAAAAPAAARLDRESLKTRLLASVAERTGYPADMLGLDQDLEAELGIDSIKKVEILGAMQKLLPAPLGEAMQTGMEKFTKARSLNGILDASLALQQSSAAAPHPAAPAVVTPVAATASPPPAGAPRYAPRLRPAPLPAEKHAIGGLYLIGADSEGLAERLAQRIDGAGGRAVVLPQAVLGDAAGLAAAIGRLRSHGPVRGLVHLAGLERGDAADLAAWKLQTARQTKQLFRLLQQLAPEFSAADGVALAASRLGGSLGREASGSASAAAGAAVGLFNCARAEWPQLRARLVDFDESASGVDIVNALFDELCVAEQRSEIGYVAGARGGEAQRVGFAHIAEPLSQAGPALVQPSADWVVLVTGGARGITAQVAEELVRAAPASGGSRMRLVLVGRTAAPAAESAATVELPEGPALRKALLDAALAAGRKPNPAELDREYRALLADREIRSNLALLAAAGAQVDYRTCDVRDSAAFARLIEFVYAQYGRIDAVLHGAGVIEDKRIADKTAESFDRVFDTKVDSAFVLSRALRPDSLKLLAFFTSVAGRFGNTGQGDYGAANETLNRLAWQLARAWPGVRVVSLNWGPWDAGMATEAVRAGFRSRGVEPIPVAAGRRFFVDEMRYGAHNDVELVVGEGPWQREGAAAQPAAASAPAAGPLPLIRRPLRIGVGGAVVLEHRLSVEDDPYLADHMMDGKPVLPAAAALEYMAQFVASGWPEWQLAEIRDLRAFSGIVLEPGAHRELSLRARSSTHSEPGQQAVTVEILDPARKGACYRATAILVSQLEEAPHYSGIVDPVPMAALNAANALDPRQVYSEMLFHGPRFQLLSAITVGSEGIDAQVKATSPRLFLGNGASSSQWLFDPGMIDVSPQLAWVWARVRQSKSALPSRFGRVVRYGGGDPAANLKLQFRLRPAPHEHAVVYDALYVDAGGRVRLSVSDGESIASAALNRLAGNS